MTVRKMEISWSSHTHAVTFLRTAPVSHDHGKAALRVTLSSLSHRSKDRVQDDLNYNCPGMNGRTVCRHTTRIGGLPFDALGSRRRCINAVRGCCPILWRLPSFPRSHLARFASAPCTPALSPCTPNLCGNLAFDFRTFLH